MTDPSNPSNLSERHERPKLSDREMSDLLDRVLISMERLQEKVLRQEENVHKREVERGKSTPLCHRS